ncbi:MAG: hypothetical protein ACRDAX_03220 [Propionibacteriaceae bacterium]
MITKYLPGFLARTLLFSFLIMWTSEQFDGRITVRDLGVMLVTVLICAILAALMLWVEPHIMRLAKRLTNSK